MLLIARCGQLLSAQLHQLKSLGLARSTVNFYHTQASPCSVEHLSDSEKIGFSSMRRRELSNNVSITQTCSIFGSGFMNDQLSSSHAQHAEAAHIPSELLTQMENYECLASISLDAITQTNVPEPYSASSESLQLDSHLDMAGLGQKSKLVASDLKGTLYPDMRRVNYKTSSALSMKPMHGLHSFQSSSACHSKTKLAVFQLGSLGRSAFSTEAKQNSADNQKQPSNAPSWKAKFKLVVAQYGPIAIVFHVAISLTSLGFFYLAVASGLDVPGLLSKFQSTFLSPEKLTSSLATGATTFTVAYAIHKVFAPVRIAITVFCVPYIARYLRRIGLLKKPQS